MSFRKEFKYRLNNELFEQTKADLLQQGMQKLHPKRIIDSIYFDTPDARMYFDSEEGILPRKKIRLRQYWGSNRTTKEKKISSIEGRFKISENYNPITFDQSVTQHQFFDSSYGLVKPILRVTYTRCYYTIGGMRVTFDSEIRYQNYRPINRIICKDDQCVIEVKTNSLTSSDFVSRYISQPTERFSKYSRGMILLRKQYPS